MNLQGFPIRAIGFASNGSEVQAGVITRDWGNEDGKRLPYMINATIFPDCATPFTRGSIWLYADESQAKKAYAEQETKMPVAYLIRYPAVHVPEPRY